MRERLEAEGEHSNCLDAGHDGQLWSWGCV